MAISSITIITADGQQSRYTGNIGISGNCVSYSGTQDCVEVKSPLAAAYAQAERTVLADYKMYLPVKTISGQRPFFDGSYFIYGDACTSIFPWAADQDMVDATVNGIAIVDQCPACNDCLSKWQLLQRIQTLQLILAAFKDNQLYSQPDAAARWSAMISKRITQDSSAYTGSCSAAPVMDQRQLFVLPALRLFTEYKALVEMWNYLVYYSSSKLRITAASQRQEGVVVSAQMRTVKCYVQTDTITLQLHAKMISGQCGAQPDVLTQNTLVYPYVHDSVASLQPDGQPAVPVEYTIRRLIGTQYNTDYNHTSVTMQVNFSGLSKISTLQATFTILPFVSRSTGIQYEPSGNQYSLLPYQLYVAQIRQGTQIVLAEASSGNVWEIQAVWAMGQQVLQRQTKLYTAPYCLIPAVAVAADAVATVHIAQDGSFYILQEGQKVPVTPVLGANDKYETSDGKVIQASL